MIILEAILKYVLRFCKGGLLRFLSNQETATAIERMLRRARLSMKFSEGFHPHPKISYSSAVATSVASAAVYALVETEEKEQQLLSRLKKQGVQTLQLLDAWMVEDSNSISDFIDGYEFHLFLPKTNYHANLPDGGLMVRKRTKKGERLLSVSEAFQNVSIAALNKYYVVKYMQHFDCLVPYQEWLRIMILADGPEECGVYAFIKDGVLGNTTTSFILNRLGGKENVRSQ